MKKITINFSICCMFCFIFSLSTHSALANVGDIHIMTENYPPFNFQQNGELKGIAVDLMVRMLETMASKKSRSDITLVPWARGYQQVLKKENTCLFAMTRTEEREDKFKWVGPISPTTIVLTAKKEKQIKINSIEDVKQYKVGVVINDIGEQLLVESGMNLKKLERLGGTNVLLQSLQKLNADRIQLFAYEENVVKWELKEKGFEPANYEAVYTLKEAELYYAFHINTPDTLIEKFQSALDNIKKEGTYQKILDDYLK